MVVKQQQRIYLFGGNRETLLYPIQQMDVSVTKLIYPQRILVSIPQEPYFNMFKGDNLLERNCNLPTKDKLTRWCLLLRDSQRRGWVDKAWGGGAAWLQSSSLHFEKNLT